MSLLLGKLPMYTFAVASISICCLMCSMFFTFYLGYAVVNLATGQVQNSVRPPVYPAPCAPNSGLQSDASAASVTHHNPHAVHTRAQPGASSLTPPTTQPTLLAPKKMSYNRGTLMLNVREVFGSKYLLSLLCPFIESRLPGDGVTFVGDPMEIPKNM